MSFIHQVNRQVGNLLVPGFYAKVTSGLGNQMFQYATLRALAARHKQFAQVVIGDYNHDYAGRRFELDQFDLLLPIAPKSTEDIFERELGFRGGLMKGLKKPDAKWFEMACVVEPDPAYYHEDINRVARPAYLMGYWQSFRYFDDFADVIKADFKIKQRPSDENMAMARKMAQSPSVAVHVRLGDYANHETIKESHGTLGAEYYVKAIEAIKQEVGSNCRFYVFSDEPAAAKNLLRWPDETVFVTHNQNTSSVWDMWLMSQCRHQVIANSTYSWWAAWLNFSPDKVIIAPALWKKQLQPKLNDLLPEKWIRI